MKESLLTESRDFKTSFLDTYPAVDNPSELIATYTRVLNESEPELPECGETINAVSVLLTNSDLRQFAESGDRSTEADEVVQGDGENLAGLNELVTQLIDCLA